MERRNELTRSIDWVIVAGTLVLTMLLLCLGVLRYTGYNASMFDIGNMAQALWSGTQGHPLVFTYEQGNFSRLALHVELIYGLIVPLYALWPDPRLLLAVQAVGFAAGAWPVYRLARRQLDSRALARASTFIYLCYPVAQTAMLFDFHGDTLALPCLLFALEAADRKAWKGYGGWIALALACKFYIALPVAVLGGVLWSERERRAGILTFIAACAWLGLALGVIRPAFAPQQAAESHATFLSYLRFYFGGVGPALLGTLVPRLMTALVVFLPGLWLGRYAWRWGLPAFALALPALLSQGDVAAYDYRFHHYAATVPFLVAATIYGAVELRRRQQRRAYRRPWRGEVWLTLAITGIFTVLLVDAPFNPLFWAGQPGRGFSEWRYGQTARDRFKDRWLAQIPPGSALAASEFLAPHLTRRATLYLVRYPDELKQLGQPDHPHQTQYLMRHPDDLSELLLAQHLGEVDYVVADALFDYTLPFGDGLQVGGGLQDAPGIALMLRQPDWGLLTAQDGLLLFGHTPAATAPLTATVTVSFTEREPALQARFGASLGLVDTSLQPLDARHIIISCTWAALAPLGDRPPLFAVSRLAGAPQSRMVHLPTLALFPTILWEPGMLIHESFVAELPPALPAGAYPVTVSWYDSSNTYAAQTDLRSRVGEEVVLGEVTLP